MKHLLRRICIIAFWLLLWQGIATAINNSILLAGPVDVSKELLRLIPQGEFWHSLLTSTARIGTGFLLAVAAAALFSLFSFVSPLFRDILSPLMSAIKTIPIASFVILLLIWTSSRYLSTAVSFLVVLPQLYFSLLAGLSGADSLLLEAANVFRISPLSRFWYIYRPALKGYFTSACQSALGMCWKSGVAAEVIGVPAGTIGEGFYLAKVNLDIPSLMAWTAAMLFISWLFEKLVLYVLAIFFKTN